MLRYLKAAFFISPEITGIGKLPVNIIALICLGILGLGEHAFWLLGAGLETGFLFLLASNIRFQRVVDAQDIDSHLDDVTAKRAELVRQLPPDAQQRLATWERKCAQIVELYRTTQTDDFVLDGNRDALTKLMWYYLKLLISQHNLAVANSQVTEQGLKHDIAALIQELQSEELSPTLRESKSATLAILKKRLELSQRRRELLREIDSDLTRIEAQIQLAGENASLHEQPAAISANIELASQLLDSDLYGDSASTVADIDAAYGRLTAPSVKSQ